MSSTDNLSALRERNKDLLMQLRNQTKTLQNITRTSSGLAGTGGGGGELDEVNETSAELLTLVDKNGGPARAALGQAIVHLKENRSSANDQTTSKVKKITTHRKNSTPFQSKVAKHTPAPAQSTGLKNRGNKSHSKPLDSRKLSAQSILLDHDIERGEQISRLTFQSPELEQLSISDRHNVQPLLGYDWIAGVLEVESSLTEHSEDFFNELRAFRQVNKDDCVHSPLAGFFEEAHSTLPLFRDKEETQPDKDTHQCTFCYRINSRLFATPIDPQESCPVCKTPKSSHPHTTAEPAYIRVSIPHSTLLPAYKYKAHRRCSFDPSDSLGLPSHCLSGWSNTGQSDVPCASNLDLRSCLITETPTGLPSAQPLGHHLDLSVSRVSGSHRSDQLLDLSRLARYSFQHLSTSCKPRNTS